MDIERRWDSTVHFSHDTFKHFWSDRLLTKRDVLLITGMGWDPRMTVLPGLLRKFGGEGLRRVHLIHYIPAPNYESPHREFIDMNMKELGKTAVDWADVEKIEIYTRKEGNFYIGDDEIAKVYARYDFSSFSDILIDISALPKSLFFTLLLILVRKADSKHPGINIHAVACQDVELDDQIVGGI